jgi:hypothetical protein
LELHGAGGPHEKRLPASALRPHEHELDGNGAMRAVAVGDGEAAVALDARGDAVLPARPIRTAEAHGLAGLDAEALDAHPVA